MEVAIGGIRDGEDLVEVGKVGGYIDNELEDVREMAVAREVKGTVKGLGGLTRLAFMN